MKTIAMIKNGLVENTALWDGVCKWNPGEEFTLVEVTGTTIGPGWTYDGENFTAPPREPDPEDLIEN